MPEYLYKDVKPGDLFIPYKDYREKVVVIGMEVDDKGENLRWHLPHGEFIDYPLSGQLVFKKPCDSNPETTLGEFTVINEVIWNHLAQFYVPKEKNLEVTRELLKEARIDLKKEHYGCNGYQKEAFDWDNLPRTIDLLLKSFAP